MTSSENKGKPIRTLDCCNRGEQVRVTAIQGGWGIRQRLHQMGIYEGETVSVKCGAALGGPRLIEIHGTGVALSRGMARHIWVEAAGE